MISVIIPVLNERPEFLDQTVKSIRETCTRSRPVEIILVDDCSSTRVFKPIGADIVIHNRHRCGGGASRHIGALEAGGDVLVFTDAHMIFQPGWDIALERIWERELICGTCIALDENSRDITDHKGRYHGAKLVILNEKEPPRTRVLTAKWAKEQPGDHYTISACMGAMYAIPRKFFFEIGGMSLLRSFGHEEELLSIKTLMAGGTITLQKAFAAGHRFRSKVGKPPYRIEMPNLLYNTMMIAHTCCRPDMAAFLISKLGAGHEIQQANDMIKQNWHSIAAEARRLQSSVFQKTWEEYTIELDALNRDL